MTYKQLKKHFITVLSIAAAARVTTQAVYKWEAAGKVPIRSQRYLEFVTGGKLKADEK